MENLRTTDHQSTIRRFILVLMIAPVLVLSLPSFAETITREADKTTAGPVLLTSWQQGAHTLDDTELDKIHGMGISFFMAQPVSIPAVILWDESDTRRSSGAASQTCITVTISGTSANMR